MTIERPSLNRKPMPPRKIIPLMLIVTLAMCVPMFILSEGVWLKIGAVTTFVAANAYAVTAALLEKRSDKRAKRRESELLDGSYYRSAEWQEKLLHYKLSDPWEQPHPRGMRYDLCRRCRRREHVCMMLVGLLLVAGAPICFWTKDDYHTLLCLPLGGWLFWTGFQRFTAKQVRDFYKKDYDYPYLEESFQRGKILSHGENGINFGTECLHAWNRHHVWNINYGIITSADRRIVRVKEYSNSLFSGDKYHYYLVVHTYYKGEFTVEVELEELQVELALETWHSMRHSAPERTETEEDTLNSVY